MKSITGVFLFSAIALVSSAELVTISTTNGTFGADALVAGGVGSGTSTFHINNYGGAPDLIVKEGALDWCRKSYVRFDLSGVGQGVVTNARLDLVVSLNAVTNATVAVYGLVNGDPGEYWIEGTGSANGEIATEGEITWDNAPANMTNSATLLLSNATLLGTISVDSNALAAGSVVSLSNDIDLVNFINADTNGVATIILTRSWSANSTPHLRFYTKENTLSQEPPVLSLAVDRAQYITTRADAYIRGGSFYTNNYGNATTLTLKGSGSSAYNRKAYLGFNLPDMSGKDVAEAGFWIEVSSTQSPAPTAPLNVWGVKESPFVDNWVEGNGGMDNDPVGEITWENAPGASSSSDVNLVNDEVAFLGTLPITNVVSGDILWFESEDMRQFVVDDEDGLLTIILESVQDRTIDLKSKESSSVVMPATMRLVLVPARGTLILVQ